MVCAGHLFLSAIDIPATMFHISMTVFLVYGIFKKPQHFCTGFYILFATISVLDVIQICIIYITLRIPACGYIPTLYLNNHWLIWLMYISTTYIEFYQLFGHTLISVNRFAVLVLPDKYDWIFTRKALYGWPILNAILPLPLIAISFRGYFQHEAGYVQLIDGLFRPRILYVEYFIDEIITVALITTPIFIATLIAFVLDLLVIIKIRHHLLSHKQTSIPLKNDIKLLFSSMVVFIAQVLLTLYYVAVSYTQLISDMDLQLFIQDQYIWISDLLSLSGSIALFAISDTTRRNYLEFYGITNTLSNPPTMFRKRLTINPTTKF